MDKTSLIVGIFFLMGSLYCIFALVTRPFETSTCTAAVLFGFIGLAFLRRKNLR